MVNEIIDRTRQIIRKSLQKVSADKLEITTDLVSEALQHLERHNDTDLVRSGLKARGAIGIRRTEGAGTNEDPAYSGYETYTKRRVAEMIDSGEFEVLTSGLDNLICAKRAQLFTNPTAYYEYVSEATGEEVEDVDETINAHREAGSYDQTLADADYVSAGVESGPVFVDWKAGHLQYTPLDPTTVHFLYHNKVADDGIDRGVDYTEIEDAAAVVIQLANSPDQTDTQNYLAIMGRSDDLPLGRYVYYTARQWYDIPKIGVANAIDWTNRSGQIANPLSVYAEQNGGGPEYPIAIIKGGLTRTTATSPMPISTSLYENALEFDIAFSRLMKDALSSALGIKAIENPRGAALPRCLEGAIALNEGQTIQLLSLPITNVQGAFDVIMKQVRFISESFGVPSYLMASETVPESGIALSIRTKPLADDLDRRGKLNTAVIARLFEIERGLYAVYANEGKTLVPPGTTQIWRPGRYIYPESAQEKLTRISNGVDKKYWSYVRGVRDMNILATDAQAKEMIDQINQDNTEYPPPSSGGGKPVNALTAGLAPRPPRIIKV